MALLAIAATAAGPARADGDAVTDRKAADARANGLNRAGDLVAQHHRLFHPHGAEAAMLVVMLIRATDAAEAHPRLQLLRSEYRRGDVFDTKIAGGVNDQGVHWGAFRVWR